MSEFEIVTVSAQPLLLVSRSSAGTPDAMAEVMSEAYGTLFNAMSEMGVAPAGPPLSIYHAFTPEEATYDVAFPLSPADAEKAKGRDDVSVAESYAGQALKGVHVGPYANLIQTYEKIMAHMTREGLPEKGPTWEVYMNDPSTTDEAELVTEIYFPID